MERLYKMAAKYLNPEKITEETTEELPELFGTVAETNRLTSGLFMAGYGFCLIASLAAERNYGFNTARQCHRMGNEYHCRLHPETRPIEQGGRVRPGCPAASRAETSPLFCQQPR